MLDRGLQEGLGLKFLVVHTAALDRPDYQPVCKTTLDRRDDTVLERGLQEGLGLKFLVVHIAALDRLD